MPNLSGTKWGGGPIGTAGGVVTWSLAPAGSDLSLFNVGGGDSVSADGVFGFDVQAAISQAFADWSSHGNIEFIQAEDPGGAAGAVRDPDIRIFFGPITGNTVGLAFFPSNFSSSAAGDILLDTSSPFVMRPDNFNGLALHEIGHALGLGHVSSNSVLTPSLSATTLQPDDVLGIQQVYGEQDNEAATYDFSRTERDLNILESLEDLTVNGNGFSNTIDGTDAAENIFGQAGNDELIGRGGADILDGGDGFDTLEGGEGNDQIIGGNGTDTAVIGARSSDVIIITDLPSNSVTIESSEGTDTFTDVELFEFNDGTISFADLSDLEEAPELEVTPDPEVTSELEEAPDPEGVPPASIDLSLGGTALADILNGDIGNDTLEGLAGADTLFGRDGNDRLLGGTGNDRVVGGSGIDTAVIRVQSSDTFIITNAFTNTVTIESAEGTDIFSDIELFEFSDRTISFSDLEDTPPDSPDLSLNGTASSDVLNGDIGNDIIEGFRGDDTLLGGDGNDILLGGDGNDSLSGDRGEDSVSGGDGSDVISGNGGNDTLDGGEGNDLVRGGNGDDLLSGGAGVDLLFGQRHGDTLNGGAGNDRLNGGGGNDVLNGGTGNDFLKGGARRDLLNGDEGDDLLVGNNFNDTLNGGAGDDRLFGGGDNDILTGGTGNDFLRAGTGSDTFIFADGDGQDTINDFEARNDAEQIDLSGVSGVSDFGDVDATQQGGSVLLDFGGGDSILLERVDLADLDQNDFVF